MQGDDLPDLVRVGDLDARGVAAVIGGAEIAGESHRLHLVRLGHPGLDAEQIQEEGGAQHGQHGAQHHAALPGAQHMEGFPQQHLGDEPADGRAQQHAQGQGHGLVIAAEEGGQEGTEAHPHAQGHAAAEHRPHQGHGDHIPSGLYVPAAVNHQGQSGQDHAHNGIAHHHHGLAEIAHAVHLRSNHGGAQGVYRGAQLHPAAGGGGAGEAIGKAGQQKGNQLIHPHHQAVENAIEGGQGQDMAGEHGAEGGEGEEEQRRPALHPQPQGQRAQGQPQHRAGHQHQVHRQGDKGHGDQRQHQEGQARQIAGQEQSLPPDRQGVHQQGGPAVV